MRDKGVAVLRIENLKLAFWSVRIGAIRCKPHVNDISVIVSRHVGHRRHRPVVSCTISYLTRLKSRRQRTIEPGRIQWLFLFSPILQI